MIRLLVGPLTANPVYNNATLLGDFYGEPDVLTFGPASGPDPRGVDLLYDLQQDTFLDVLRRLPVGWEPDLILWWDLAFQPLIAGIAQCPYPLAVVTGDWNLTGLTLRHTLGMFDFVLGDLGLIQRLQALGYNNHAWFRAYSFDPAIHFTVPTEPCYDVLFIGNLNDRIHARRSQYLQQLATLGDRYRIHLANGIFGAEYRQLLNQSRLVFNHSVRGEMNMRAYEAPACGIALLMEADNLEIAQVLVPEQDYIPYQADLLERIATLLTQTKHLHEIAQAGLTAIQHESYTCHFAYLLKHLAPQAIAAFKGIEKRPFNQADLQDQQQAEIRQWWATQKSEGLSRLWQAHTQAPLNIARATVLSASQDTSLALELCADWQAAEPSNPLVLCHKAYLLQQQEQFSLANQIWLEATQNLATQALTSTPKLQWPAGYQSWLPLALERRGLEQSPTLQNVWWAWSLFNQGLCCLQLEQFTSAILLFEQALQLAPDLYEAWFYLGQAQEAMGDTGGAYRSYLRAKESGVMLVSLWQALAHLHLVLGEAAQAVAVLQIAQTLLGEAVSVDLLELSLIAQATVAWQAQCGEQWASCLAQIQDLSARCLTFDLHRYSPFVGWCQSISIHWQASTHEPPLLLPHWRQTAETTAMLRVTDTFTLPNADPPDSALSQETHLETKQPKQHCWQRRYQPMGFTKKQCGWTELPFRFPEIAPAEGQLEELNRWNWLLLWESQATVCWDFLAAWLQQFATDITHTCFLLTTEMTPAELVHLEAMSQSSQAAVVVLAQASLSVAEQRQLLQSVQVVVGGHHRLYDLYWAMWLGRPVLPLESLDSLPEINDPLWLEWVELLKPWYQVSWVKALVHWTCLLQETIEHAVQTRQDMQNMAPKLEQRWRQTWWRYLLE